MTKERRDRDACRRTIADCARACTGWSQSISADRRPLWILKITHCHSIPETMEGKLFGLVDK